MAEENRLVQATCDIALNGLYMTSDMSPFIAFIEADTARLAAERIHSRQPRSRDYASFSTYMNDHYVLYRDVGIDTSGMSLVMATYDLAHTHRQLRRFMFSASDVLSALMLRNTSVHDDDNIYPRIIPPALDDIAIRNWDDVTENIVLRVLTAEPWVGWMEQFRAQQARTRAVLNDNDLLPMIDGLFSNVTEFLQVPRPRPKLDRSLRKRTRRSADLFVRHLGRDQLKQFLHSKHRDPLRLRGHRYNYELIIYKDTLLVHGADLNAGVCSFHVEVHDKDGRWLCDLCHYFPDTPPLDGVVAMALHVQNPELEFEFLRAACVNLASRHFYTDDVLPALKEMPYPELAPTMINNILHYSVSGVLRDQLDEVRARICRHGYRLFSQINNLRPQYLPRMRECGLFGPAEFVAGNARTKPFEALKRIQEAYMDGDF